MVELAACRLDYMNVTHAASPYLSGQSRRRKTGHRTGCTRQRIVSRRSHAHPVAAVRFPAGSAQGFADCPGGSRSPARAQRNRILSGSSLTSCWQLTLVLVSPSGPGTSGMLDGGPAFLVRRERRRADESAGRAGWSCPVDETLHLGWSLHLNDGAVVSPAPGK